MNSGASSSCPSSRPYLEALLLLRREPEQPWDAPRLARRLYIPEKRSAELLQALLAAHMLINAEGKEPAYCYRPGSAELAWMITRLAEWYEADLVGVTNLIHATPANKAKKFADAFIWRKKPDV